MWFYVWWLLWWWCKGGLSMYHTIKFLHCCGHRGILVVSLSIYVLVYQGLLCLLLRFAGCSAKTSPWLRLRINQKHIRTETQPLPFCITPTLPPQLHPPHININLFFDKVYLLNLLSWPFTSYFTLLNLSPVTIQCVWVDILKKHLRIPAELSQKRYWFTPVCVYSSDRWHSREEIVLFTTAVPTFTEAKKCVFQWEKDPEW